MIFRFEIYHPDNKESYIIVNLNKPDYADDDSKPEDIVRWLWEDLTGYLEYSCEIILDRVTN